MRVAVFGASGVQGAAQVAALARAGHHPVAISRNPKALEIDQRPIETVAADWSDADTLVEALKDADAVFLNLPPTAFQPSEYVIHGARNIGETAIKTPSIRLLVFNTSMPIPAESQKIEAQDDCRTMTAILRGMGLPVISINPSVYLENLLEGWALPPIRDRNTVVYCHTPTQDVSWICLDDVARLMVAAMERSELAGRDFAVGGPETVRLSQLAEKLGRAWGRPLKYECQPIEEFCSQMDQAMRGRKGLDTDELVDQVRRAYTYYNTDPEEPFNIDMGPILNELPVQLTPIEEWARRRLPPGVEQSSH